MTSSKNSKASTRASIAIVGCLALLFLSALSAPEKGRSSEVGTADPGESSKVKPKASSKRKATGDVRRIPELIQKGRYQEVTMQWEHASSRDQDLFRNELAWDLAQAYLKQKAYEKAIEIYKPQYHFITESIEQRAKLGKVLLFGKVGTRPRGEYTPVGEAQCTLCHAVTKESGMADPFYYASPPWGPHLFDFAQRIKSRIASHQYQQRPKDTKQPEAFPGSGIATSVIEYLAESNVCPSCFVVPGFGSINTDDRESPMPKIHKPPISLTIDEMTAIDTWLLREDGAAIPSLAEMRAAYEKFVRPEDRPPNYEGIRLASLYDAKGDLDEAIRLLDTTYPTVLLRGEWGLYELRKLREDPHAFRNLKQRPNIVARFPKLLQPERR